jgi:hypothetical protein
VSRTEQRRVGLSRGERTCAVDEQYLVLMSYSQHLTNNRVGCKRNA